MMKVDITPLSFCLR